jgi:hypothetical protein
MDMTKRESAPWPSEVYVQRRNKKVMYNLDQATGWLSGWRAGRSLTGRNARHSFNIPYNEYEHIVLLSVINCGDEYGEYHPDFVQQEAIALRATIPQTALMEISRIEGSMTEVIQLICALLICALGRLAMDGIPLVNATEVLMAGHKSAIEMADPSGGWLHNAADAVTSRI